MPTTSASHTMDMPKTPSLSLGVLASSPLGVTMPSNPAFSPKARQVASRSLSPRSPEPPAPVPEAEMTPLQRVASATMEFRDIWLLE